MAVTTLNDLKIYDPRIQGGYIETIRQQIDAWNKQSGGTIILRQVSKPGEFDYEALFQNVPGIVERRDPNSTAAVTPKKLTQAEIVTVKLNDRIGPLDATFDSFRKAGLDSSEDTIAFVVGEIAGRHVIQTQLNTVLRAGVAALSGQVAVLYDVGGPITTDALVNGLSKFGDHAAAISVWVMHSATFYKLVSEQIAQKIDGISNFNIAEGMPVTLGRPVIVTDSEALKVDDGAGGFDYYTLGLVPSALVAEDTEEEKIVGQIQTGLDNLVYRIQGEYAYNIGVRGFAWDVANGGANPNTTAISTSSNWDPVMQSHKDFAGVIIKSK